MVTLGTFQSEQSYFQNCRLVAPNKNSNKNLIPPPLNSEKHLYVHISIKIVRILYIDEITKYMKIYFTFQKEWFNSFLTFQNLNKESRNTLFPEDVENMWIPMFASRTTDDENKCTLKEHDVAFVNIIPNENFEYEHNPKSDFQNALLFQDSELFMKYYSS